MAFNAEMGTADRCYHFESEAWPVPGISHPWSEDHFIALVLIPQPQRNFWQKDFAFIHSYRNLQFHN